VGYRGRCEHRDRGTALKLPSWLNWSGSPRDTQRGEPDVSSPNGESDLAALEVVPTRHYAQWAGSLVALVIGAMGVHLLVTNEQFQWDVVAKYLFSPVILSGVRLTLELTVISMGIGVSLGIVLAVMRTSDGPLLRAASGGYLWFFRGTPLLVQLIFWFNLGALLPELSLGIPFGPTFMSWETNSVISPLMAALLGLGLNEAAYMAEVVRAGLLSVDEGQTEAAQALGMRPALTLRRIVMPQAMRVIIPPTGSRTIQMLKTSSLVSVLALPELLHSAQVIYSRTFQTIPLLVVASIWYLLFTSVLSAIQRRIEAHYGRGSSRHATVEDPRWKRLLDKVSTARMSASQRLETDDD